MAPMRWRDGMRAGGGVLLGIAVLGAIALAAGLPAPLAAYLIPPFGASAVLLFAVPNSPLAQPWSAVMGNTVSALVGVAGALWIGDPLICAAAVSGLAILAMMLVRAMHPPGVAVAMMAALNPAAMREAGFLFALFPVAAGTAVLVAVAMVYARATGRRYPFRQMETANPQGTADPPALERTGLSRAELTAILRDLRQSPNIGVEDLARLIAAAEIQSASHRLTGLTCADIMSRDLVTVGPGSHLSEVIEIFRERGFTSIPVVGAQDRFLGVIFQIHLIRSGFDASADIAAEVMERDVPSITAEAPVAALLPLLGDGQIDAVPVLDGPQIVGIVTQTDLIAALARVAAGI